MMSGLARIKTLILRSGRHDVLFYASSAVDELWVRSTCLALADKGMDCCLAIGGPGLKPDIAALYRKHKIPVYDHAGRLFLKKTSARIVITASSGIPAAFFPQTVQYRVHMPHSIASLHMIYAEGCFDGYDALFAVGPHHRREFAALSGARGLGNRPCYDVGYGKLDVLSADFKSHAKPDHGKTHILLAPSWGKQNIINTVGVDLIGAVLGQGYKITLRPHPLFFVEKDPLIDVLNAQFGTNQDFSIESSLSPGTSMFDADILITDYSGTAQEFSALRREPVVFVDVAKKILNPDWEKLGLTPIEIESRGVLGPLANTDCNNIMAAIRDAMDNRAAWKAEIDGFIPSFLFAGRCADNAVGAVMDLLSDVEKGARNHG